MPPRTPRKAPATAAPLSHEERLAVAREAVKALPGLRAADLKKKLPKPLQARHAEVLEALKELAASGDLFGYVTTKAERFFAADPIATLDRVVPEILDRSGPLDPKAILRAVAAAAPGHEEPLAAWMKTAPKRRLIFEHAPAPKSRAKRFGSTPDLRRLLSKTLAELHKALAAIEADGVPRERVLETIREDLGLSAAPIAKAPESSAPSTSMPSDRDVVRAALDKLVTERPAGTLLHARDLRARTPLDKERFDAAALALSREGVVVLHHHDHPAALSEEERRALITDGRGMFYIGIAPRSAE